MIFGIIETLVEEISKILMTFENNKLSEYSNTNSKSVQLPILKTKKNLSWNSLKIIKKDYRVTSKVVECCYWQCFGSVVVSFE